MGRAPDHAVRRASGQGARRTPGRFTRRQTGDQWWSGTDSRIQLEIYRDGDLIKRLNLEPGNTPRLHRGEFANYFWVFKDPDGLGTSVSGTTVPYSVRFPKGVGGHLRVKFVPKGDD